VTDETCFLLAVDFDKAGWREDAAAFLETCRELGLPAALERSRSGRGAHVWFFFEEAIPAACPQTGIACSHRDNGKTPGHRSRDSYDRLFPNQELRSLLDHQIDSHCQSADHWRREQERTPDQETDDKPLLPDHMCANEAERHQWRADVLNHARSYRRDRDLPIGEADLAFGELMPDKPGWLEHEEYEERTNVGFQLERITKTAGRLTRLIARSLSIEQRRGVNRDRPLRARRECASSQSAHQL
jgi:TOTE conflict system primase-like protein